MAKRNKISIMHIGKKYGKGCVVFLFSLTTNSALSFRVQLGSRTLLTTGRSYNKKYSIHPRCLKRTSVVLYANSLVGSEKKEEIFSVKDENIPSKSLGIGVDADKNNSMLWKSRLLIIFAASLYGSNHSAVKILESNIPLEVGTTLRFALAAAITLPWLFQDEDNQSDSNSQSDSVATKDSSNQNDTFMSLNGAILGGAEIGFWNWMGYMAQAIGLQSTPAGTNAFICSLSVVIVPILDMLVGKKVLTRQMIGAALAVLGVGFLELNGLQENLSSGQPIISSDTCYSLVQPIAFGVGYWRMEFYARKYENSAKKLTSAQLCTIASLMAGNMILTSQDVPDLSMIASWFSNPIVLQAVLWTGLVTTALTMFIETQALKTLSAAEATLLYTTEPIFGSIIAAAVLNESLGVGGVIGAAMILCGCLYSSVGFDDNTTREEKQNNDKIII